MAGRKKGGGGPGHGMMPGEKAQDFKGTILKLFSYMKPYKPAVFAVFVAAVASTVFTIVSPTVLGRATDIVIEGISMGSIDYHRLLNILILLLALYLAAWLFGVTQSWIMSIVSQKIIYTIRKELSEKIDRLPLKYFDKVPYGEVQSRMINDIETVNQTLTANLTQMITSAVTLVGIIVMMVRINIIMTLAAMLVIPVSMLIIKAVVGKSQKHFRNQQKYLGLVNGHVEEMYSGHDIVKAFNREEISQADFDEYNDKLCEAAWKSQSFSGFMMPATQFVGNLAYVMVCLLGGFLAIRGSISIGQIQAFIQYVRSFNQPVQQVANIANQLQSTAAAAERVFEILAEEEEIDDSPESEAFAHEPKGEVTFENIEFGYKENEPVIRDFSFAAHPGRRVAIVGPTGAGKTTIVKLLMRFYEPDKGRILIDGCDVRNMKRRELRECFGMVLQDTWLNSGTVRDNIRYGRMDATDEEVETAAKAAFVDHFIRTQEKGYDMEINEEATNISAGQKQLLTIARAILADAPILILDEATSSVDTRTERMIQDAMDNLMHGRTCFIIAHRLSTIKDADHILVMENGNIVEQGNHKELLEKGGVYSRLYNSQFVHDEN